MKNHIFLLLFSVILWSCGENPWENALEKNSIVSFQEFIDENPESEFIKDAEFKLDSLLEIKELEAWDIAYDEYTSESMQKYIDEYPDGNYANWAREQVIVLAELEIWYDLKEKESALDYFEFMDNYPESIYLSEAKEKINELLEEDFRTDFREVVEFINMVNDSSTYETIESYVNNNILISYDYSVCIDNDYNFEYVDDSSGFEENNLNYIFKMLNESISFKNSMTSESGYYLGFLNNGITYSCWGEWGEYYTFYFFYEKNKLFLTEIDITQHLCD